MLDKHEAFLRKFTLLFELISCVNNTALSHIRYDKLPQNNEILTLYDINDTILGLQSTFL